MPEKNVALNIYSFWKSGFPQCVEIMCVRIANYFNIYMKQNYKICRGKKNHSRWLSTQHLDKSSTHYQLTIVTFIFTSTKYIKETLIYIFLNKYFNQQQKKQ